MNFMHPRNGIVCHAMTKRKTSIPFLREVQSDSARGAYPACESGGILPTVAFVVAGSLGSPRH